MILANAQHEKFAQLLFSGKSQEEAAIEAGYKAKWARSCASHLATKATIKGRVTELFEALASKKIMSKQERMEMLSQIARDPFKYVADTASVIRAMAELSKLDGSYAPEKHDVNHTATDMTTEEIMRRLSTNGHSKELLASRN